MSALDPSGPSQPNQQSGLNQANNAASKTSQEQTNAVDTESTSQAPIDHRGGHKVPSNYDKSEDSATSTAMGYGDRGPLMEKDISESDAVHEYSDDPNTEGEQMRMAGEGDVADAVRSGGGGGHKDADSITADLDSKTKEHEEELHKRGHRTGKEIEDEEHEDWTGRKADIGEALGGRGNKIVLAPEE